MTITFPDVSNFQRGLVIQPGTSFVWAKASEGTYLKDDTYANFKAQAAKVGAGFGGYHFLTSGNGSAQADVAFSVVGRGVPLFVDTEPIPRNNSFPTVADVKAFTARYRALGGTCEAMYYPKWYWANQGSPSLSVTGLKLISSGYPAGYSDNDANWNPYGGLTPFQWQFSDSYEYGGMRVDFNAFKGTIDEYLVAIGAKSPIPVPPPPPPSTTSEDDDMQQIEPVSVHPGEYVYPVVSKKAFRLAADGYGAEATLRVVVWAGHNASVHDGVVVAHDFVDIPLDPATTSAVTVKREDSNEFPVGVAVY